MPRDTVIVAAEPSTGLDKRNEICVLMNAGSGKKQVHDRIETLHDAFGRFPGRFHLRLVRNGGEIGRETDRALAEGFGTIVAAGGDGTISTVAGCLMEEDCRLGVIPLGTFNYFARANGIPDDPAEAVEAIATGQERRIGVGEVNGQVFLNNASIGAYPEILAQREDIYRRYGRSRIAAHWSVVTTLVNLRRPLTLRIVVDGEERRMKTPLAFVANSAYQLDEFGLDGTECLQDGQFALIMAPDCGRFELVRNAIRLARGQAQQGRDFEMICGRDILIEASRKRRHVAWDGERCRMRAPFRFRRHDDAIRLMVPKD